MNEAPDTLALAVQSACGRPFDLEWVSPLAGEQYREYKDADFLRALGLGHHVSKLKAFWPSSGPRWDALARCRGGSGSVVLVEAKSHIAELYGNGCKATSEWSLQLIRQAFARTQDWLSMDGSIDWLTGRNRVGHVDRRTVKLYQTCNRLAHLFLLREVLGVDAWLIQLYFVDDPRTRTTEEQWRAGVGAVKAALGITATPYAVDVFLPVAREWA